MILPLLQAASGPSREIDAPREPIDSALWTGRLPRPRREFAVFTVFVDFEPGCQLPAALKARGVE